MLRLKQFYFNAFQVSTFVVYDSSGVCVIIDPGCSNSGEQQELVDFIETTGLKPLAILNTHGHVDHLLGVAYCMQKWDIPFLIHQEDLPQVRTAPAYAGIFGLKLEKVPAPSDYLIDEQVFTIGEEELKIWHVPGHSPGSLAFYSASGSFLIAGDALFAGSIGRTDLPGGNHATLLKAIREKLLVLPENTIVFPGHGPNTTIGKEKVENPYLQ